MSDVPSHGSWPRPEAAQPVAGPEPSPEPASPEPAPPEPAPPLAPPDAPPEGGEPRWPPWTAFAALLAALFVSQFAVLLIQSFATVFGADFEDPPPAVNIVATFVLDGTFILAAVLFAARAGVVRPAQFGLSAPRLGRAVAWAAGLYVGYWILTALWATAIGIEGRDSLPDSLGVDESTAALVAVCVLVTVAAPISEELLFRGYMFGALRDWRGPWPAALITGVLFGAVHLVGQEPEYLVPLAVLGVALCLVRWKTGSLLPCIALHAINNALAFSVAESWTVGQGLLLVIGATTVSLLLCRPFLAPREQPA